jgi:hypothetical protein
MREPAVGDAAIISAAQAALLEVTGPETVGPLKGLEESVDGVVDVRFTPTMDGYPGWNWVVSVSVLDGRDAPSVLELSLLPAEGALTAPEWVPWSERLADYRAAQEAKGDGLIASDEDEDDESDELDDSDDDELAEDVDETDLLVDEDDLLDGVVFEHDEHDDEADDDEDDEPAAEVALDEGDGADRVR